MFPIPSQILLPHMFSCALIFLYLFPTSLSMSMSMNSKYKSKNKFGKKQENKWNERFVELCDYKIMKGDCIVPRNYDKNPKLGTWVHNQRYHFDLFMKSDDRTFLTVDRIRALDGIVFVWDLNDYKWQKRYRELCNYRKLNGNTFVLKSNQPLSSWVRSQQRQYNLLLKGKTCALTKERIARLGSIGFIWTSSQQRWDVMFQSALAYRKENGNFNIISSDIAHLPLKSWITRQRNEYMELKKNPSRKSSLTPARIESLDQIGFQWEGPRIRAKLSDERSTTAEDWNLLFDRLRETGVSSKPPKQHWFDGYDRFDDSPQLSDYDDLDSLWQQEED